MERFSFHLSRNVFSSALSSLERPDLMWKVILSVTSLIALIIGTFSFIMYRWATHSTIPTASGKEIGTVTKEEIRSVIDLYKAKQKLFIEIKTTRPVPPALGSGVGVEVESSPVEEVPPVILDSVIPTDILP